MWKIVLIVLVLIIILILYTRIRKNTSSFNDWVKNPNDRDIKALKMLKNQNEWQKRMDERDEIQKNILSLNEDAFFQKLPDFQTEDEFNACLKKFVLIGNPKYFNEFESFYSRVVYNKDLYIKEGLEQAKKVKDLRGVFYKRLYSKALEKLKSNNYSVEELLDILWLIDPMTTANLLSQPEWHTTSSSTFLNILKSFTKYNATLDTDYLIKLFEKTKADLSNTNSGYIATELLVIINNKGISESKKYAYQLILNKSIDKYSSSKIANLICSNYGIENVDNFFEKKYKDELKKSFPFNKGEELYKDWISIITLDAQVDNGGFAQYFSNGYGYQFTAAIDAAEKIGDKSVLSLLLSVKNELNYFKPQDDYSDEKLANIYDKIKRKLDDYDREYYRISSKLDARLKLYLVSKIKGVNLLKNVTKS